MQSPSIATKSVPFYRGISTLWSELPGEAHVAAVAIRAPELRKPKAGKARMDGRDQGADLLMPLPSHERIGVGRIRGPTFGKESLAAVRVGFVPNREIAAGNCRWVKHWLAPIRFACHCRRFKSDPIEHAGRLPER